MTDKDDEIAVLKAKIDKLEAKVTPTPYDDAAAREWANHWHQMREERAAAHMPFHRDQLKAMNDACSAADIKDLVSHGTIPSRSAAGTSGQVTKYSSNPGIPGSNTGWINPTPLGPPPGIGYVDRLGTADLMALRHSARSTCLHTNPSSPCQTASTTSFVNQCRPFAS